MANGVIIGDAIFHHKCFGKSGPYRVSQKGVFFSANLDNRKRHYHWRAMHLATDLNCTVVYCLLFWWCSSLSVQAFWCCLAESHVCSMSLFFLVLIYCFLLMQDSQCLCGITRVLGVGADRSSRCRCLGGLTLLEQVRIVLNTEDEPICN